MWEILGIAPTNDIKEIKTAYAKLAKKYNPEEHPEEFRRVHDAYKSACDFAKGRRTTIRTPLLNVTAVSHEIKQDVRDEEYKFPEGGKAPEKTREKFISDDRADNTEEYDFPDGEKAPEKTREKFISDDKAGNTGEYEFPEGGKASDETREPFISIEEEAPEEYDFSGIDTERDFISEEDRLDMLRTHYISRIYQLLESSKMGLGSDEIQSAWQRMLDEGGFREISKDKLFRGKASALLKTRKFPYRTAEMIAAAFGGGAYVFIIDLFLMEFKVSIPTYLNRRRQVFPDTGGSKQVPNFAAYTIILIVILSFIVAPVMHFSRNSGKQRTPPQAEQVTETGITPLNIPVNVLLQHTCGKWESTDGSCYFEISAGNKYVMTVNGETVFSGTIAEEDCEPGESAEIYITLSPAEEDCTDTAYLGETKLHALLIPPAEIMQITFPDGAQVRLQRPMPEVSVVTS